MYFRQCKNYAVIPDNTNYCITMDGVVMRIGEFEVIEPVEKDFIYLDGKGYYISTLLVHAFIGVLPFPVVPFGHYYPLMHLAMKYSYYVKDIIPDPENDMVYWLDGIEFRMIPNTPSRSVISRNGVIFSLRDNRFAYMRWNGGYRYATTRIHFDDPNTESITMLAAAMVYRAYFGKIPADMQVDHIDNCSIHDNADNVQLLTHLDNTRKSRYEGRRGTPYTYEMIDAACKAISENEPNSKVAEILGLNYDEYHERKRTIKLVYKLKNQKGYYDGLKEKYHLDQLNYDTRVNYDHTRLTDDQVMTIKARLNAGELGKHLAAEYHVSPAIISKIRNNTRQSMEELSKVYVLPED